MSKKTSREIFSWTTQKLFPNPVISTRSTYYIPWFEISDKLILLETMISCKAFREKGKLFQAISPILFQVLHFQILFNFVEMLFVLYNSLATWNFIRSPKNHSDKFPLYFCFLWNKIAIVWRRFTTGTCSKNNFFPEGGGGRALTGPFWHQPHVLNDRALNVCFFLNNTSRFLKKTSHYLLNLRDSFFEDFGECSRVLPHNVFDKI